MEHPMNGTAACFALKNDVPACAGLDEFIRDVLTPAAGAIDRSDEIPDEIYRGLARLGLPACEPPGAAGLKGTDAEAVRQPYLHRVLQELAAVSPGVAKAVLDQNVGQIGMIREYLAAPLAGPLLAEVAAGDVEVCFAMTEPHGGSQVRHIATQARRVEGGYEISGSKDWITGAHRRRMMAVVARDADAADAIGLFLVDRREVRDGAVVLSDRKEKLGLRGLGEFAVRFDRAFCPAGHVVVPPSGQGLRAIMKHYNFKRCAQAAMAQGIARGALRAALDYGSGRFTSVPAPDAMRNLTSTAAQFYAEVQAGQQLRQWALEQLLAGDGSGVPGAMAKLFNTELAVRVTNAMMQACGANGLSSKLPIERLMRDARMLTVAGGASEVLRATVERHLPQLL
jgi:alkylation response protein AidB-like acyl-CoA dehydrogenase